VISKNQFGVIGLIETALLRLLLLLHLLKISLSLFFVCLELIKALTQRLGIETIRVLI
jgi:hypothetical protein